MVEEPTNPNNEEEVLEQPSPEQLETEAPVDQEQAEEVEFVEEDEPEDEPQEEQPKPSRRESLRVQQLLEKMKQAEPSQQPKARQQGINYGEALDADPEVIEQLEADRQRVSQQSYEQGIRQAESIKFHTRLEIDAPKVESKYTQLNRESDEFNPVLANALNQWYLSTVGYDPNTGLVQNSNVRYSEFVEGIMELADEIGGSKVQQTQKNVAKQAASTGLRPDGSRTKRVNLNKAPQDMTDEELKLVIGKMTS